MRWILRSLLALLAFGVAAVALVFLVPTDRVGALAAERFSQITGRALTIEGAIRPSFWPVLGVRTGPVSVANADWSSEGPMLRAQALDIGIDMSGLLQGDVRITGIRAVGLDLILERAADGRENWVFGGTNGGTAAPGMAGEGKPFTLDLAEVTGGKLTFIDHASKQRLALLGLEAAARIPSFVGPADLSLSAELHGQPFAATANVAEFAPFLAGKVVGLTLDLQAGQAKIGFKGRGGWQPFAAEGELVADLANLAEVSALAGAARPALPMGLGAQAVTVAGGLTVTAKGSVHLRGARVGLDGNPLSVDADLTTGGDRPNLSAQVAAGALALPGLMVGGADQADASQGAAADPAAGWSSAPIDVAGLGVMDASVALTADAIDLGRLKLGTTRALMTIDRARAVFDLRRIDAYQGNVTGQFVLNGRGGLSVGGDLRLANLSMQPLLTDLAGYDRLSGTGNVAVKFLGVGNSLDEIMQGLSGSGSVQFTKGELRGLDVAGMLRTLDPGFVGEGQKTIFEAIAASFAVENGILTNDDLALTAPYVTATGAGRVGIGPRTIDYRLRPTALASVDGTGGVMVPLLVTGPWAKPKFRLDLESIAREKLEAEAKALEERAKAEAKELEARAKADLERKAQEELGIVRQDGESLEDAAKRRAQEALDAEAARVLERLLGGGSDAGN